MLYRFIGPNLKGRDFIVADLHGCLDELMHELDAVKFNPAVDRLFCVGDLIDRGPYSFRCLKLLQAPWFYAVRGNHEALLLDFMQEAGPTLYGPTDFLRNGGDWVTRLSSDEYTELVEDLLPRLRALPLVLHVDHPTAPFNVLHAEATELRGECLTDATLLTEDLADRAAPLLWARRIVGEGLHGVDTAELKPGTLQVTDTPFEPGLSLTYVGHTILPGALLHRSHLFLDGGAFKPYMPAPEPGQLNLVEHGALLADLLAAGVLPA